MSGESDHVDPTQVAQTPDDRGTEVDRVVVEIDYAIIDHFSSHLYGSPNKAVEELVANGFDAFATGTYVYVPGKYVQDKVLVWDNGDAMDVEELKRLWWIARSPKGTGERREVRQGSERLIIGKFGIGKLASYAVGQRVTHLSRRGGDFFRVTVDYRGVPTLEDEADKLVSPVLRLTEEEARAYVEAQFLEHPTALDDLWGQEHWTLAVIDEMKPGIRIPEGRLRWVLGNGMPLRPDFQVFVNDEEVVSKLAEGADTNWDLSAPTIRAQLGAEWRTAVAKGDVEGELEFVDPDETHPASVRFPALGDVRASVRVFRESLIRGRAADLARSHGFFVLVRGRLLNPEDDLLFLHDPSFGTFYRSQYVINADGLDEDLLADRERLQRTTPRTNELAVLQRALYYASRDRVTEMDQGAAHERDSASLLPVDSRETFREPLSALMLRRGSGAGLDPTAAKVNRAPLAEDQPLATFEPETGSFNVNENHPLIETLTRRLGGGKKAREALRAIDLVAVSERLLEGFLYDIGIEEDQIERVLAWRESLFRAYAARLDAAREDVVRKAYEMSYVGDKEFEDALAEVFRFMGFNATRDGAPGEKDVLVVAPVGEAEFRFTVEAKGSGGPVANDTAHVGGVDSHRNKVGADFAVIVAREFTGFKAKEKPAILEECEQTDGRVTIATMDVIADLCEAVREYSYPLDLVPPVLKPLETPDAKLLRVAELEHPTEDFDFRAILDEIWVLQNGAASGDVVPSRQIYQTRDEWKKMGFESFERRLSALEVLARGLIRVSTRNETVTLLQNPEITAEQIQRSVDERAAE